MSLLQYGLFHDFKTADTLLFHGDPSELSNLSTLFREVAAGSKIGNVALNETVGFRPRRGTSIVLRITTGDVNRIDVAETMSVVAVTWALSPATADDLLQWVLPLIDAAYPCHAYLPAGGPLQVMVSKGEYPASIFDEPTGVA